MLRLNKKTEYALLALGSLAEAPLREEDAAEGTELVTSKAIAQRYLIPEMLLAKVLQRLKKSGFVKAAKGSGGGYRLARPLSEMPLLSVFELFDEHISLVDCQDHRGPCQQMDRCTIKDPLAILNAAVMEPLRRMSVQDLFVKPSVLATEATRNKPFAIVR